MLYVIALILTLSGGSAWAETRFDGSSPSAARASVRAMGQEADGQMGGKTFHALLATIKKIDTAIERKYRPVDGQSYDPALKAAKQAEYEQLLNGKTTREILAMAARLP